MEKYFNTIPEIGSFIVVSRFYDILLILASVAFAFPRHVFKKRVCNLNGLFKRDRDEEVVVKSVAKKLFETRTQYIRSLIQSYVIDVLSIAICFAYCFAINELSGKFFMSTFDFKLEALEEFYHS